MKFFAYIVSAIAILAISPVNAQQRAVPQAQVRKPIVGVKEMKDLANTGQSEAFSTMILTAITNGNRFRVIERQLGNLADERALQKSGTVTSRNPGQRALAEGVDFLIYGTITQGQTKAKTDVGSTLGMAVLGGFLGARNTPTCAIAVASLEIDIRIVDTGTGQVRWADTIRHDQRSGSTCGPNGTIDYMALFRTAAQKISSGLTLALYPMKVAGVQPDGLVLLNYGEDTLKVGDTLKIFSDTGGACAAVDPDSGECLSKGEGTEIGMVQVTEVMPRFSRAAMITQFAAAPATGSVARFAPPPPPPSKKKGRR